VNRLTAFQTSVARLFFGVARSRGYLLGGGGALLAHGLTSRPTQDLDFVGSPSTERADFVAEQFAHTAQSSGIASRTVQRGDTFTRLVIGVDTQLVIDFAIDVPPILQPVVTAAGPTFAPEELAARKLTALFGRAEARDFTDIYALCQVFPKSLLIERAKQIDLGFNEAELATAIRSVRRFRPSELPASQVHVEQVVQYFLEWADELLA
jgi:predicted nucleotidyltransferase component of viral defense system